MCIRDSIGSPLGLFNSVSNGIISGFRKLDGVDMIQFTAPISHGSSGGAVLNSKCKRSNWFHDDNGTHHYPSQELKIELH